MPKQLYDKVAEQWLLLGTSQVWANCRSVKRVDYTGGVHGSSVDGESDYSRSTWLGSAVGNVVCWMHMKFLVGAYSWSGSFEDLDLERHELYYCSSPWCKCRAQLKAPNHPGCRSWCSYPGSLILHVFTTIHANFLHTVCRLPSLMCSSESIRASSNQILI